MADESVNAAVPAAMMVGWEIGKKMAEQRKKGIAANEDMMRFAGHAEGDELPVMGHGRFELRSWLMGFAFGAAGKPGAQSPVGPMPVGYLYGHIAGEGETPTHTVDGVDYVGVVMDALPERDEEKYPYLIVHDVGRWGAWASAGKTVSYIYSSIDGDYMVEFAGGYLGTDPVHDENLQDTTQWHPWVEAAEDKNEYIELSNILWSNFDVYYENGKLCLAASDPIPIYE